MMETYQITRMAMGSLSVLATFAVVVAAVVVAFNLMKSKQGAAGGWLLVLARTGVWLITTGFLFLTIFSRSVDMDTTLWSSFGLRLLLLVAYFLTLVAFLLIRPAKVTSGEDVGHG